MRGKAGAPLRRLESELRAHRPRQPRIGRGLSRPCAFVEPAEHDEVEIQQASFQRSEDREPLLAVVRRAHCARFGEFEEQFGVMAAVGQRDPVAVADHLDDQVRGRFSRLVAPQCGGAVLGIGCRKGLGRLGVRTDEVGQRHVLHIHRGRKRLEHRTKLREPFGDVLFGLACQPAGNSLQPATRAEYRAGA